MNNIWNNGLPRIITFPRGNLFEEIWYFKESNKVDRSSPISQVHAFNVTDSCYRMTRKLNESNMGWQSSTQAPILEVGWIKILCSTKDMSDNNNNTMVNNMSLQTEFFHLLKISNSGTTQPNQTCFATF